MRSPVLHSARSRGCLVGIHGRRSPEFETVPKYRKRQDSFTKTLEKGTRNRQSDFSAALNLGHGVAVHSSVRCHNKTGWSVVGYFGRCSMLFGASLRDHRDQENTTKHCGHIRSPVTLQESERIGANERARVYTCPYPFHALPHEKAQATGKRSRVRGR